MKPAQITSGQQLIAGVGIRRVLVVSCREHPDGKAFELSMAVSGGMVESSVRAHLAREWERHRRAAHGET